MLLTKRLDLWCIFALISCGAGIFSYKYMNKVYSLVSLSITKDRYQILTDAQKVATELSWNLKNYQNVTSFESQDMLQCFVELQAGGKDAFVKMFESDIYHPYQWHVRFFKEKELIEMHLIFSPQGKRLGFSYKLPEQAEGKALSKQDAEKIAHDTLVVWCPSYDKYGIIEYDAQTQATGRVDHTFTYERKDVTIGKGLYRFTIKIAGNQIVKVVPLVKIPDTFLRSYKEMRSANNLLAAIGSFFFQFLYILIFCVIGLIFFYRKKYFDIRYAMYASAIVAGGIFSSGLNNYPLWWSSYNTVQSGFMFVMTKISEQLLHGIYIFILIFIPLLIAHAAGKYCYKHHLQFFKIFSFQGCSSYDVAQQVILGYLLVPFMFAYVIMFGYITQKYFGWWSPAGSLFDPNIVASYFPWLSAIAISLQAGFLEEIIFRALPLAMMALMTRTSRYKEFWSILIFIAQALIFGACHASYPNQPSYARIIELIAPSFLFGWTYLRFGLLPGVITHFVYDVVWFSMPVFNSNLFWSKIIVICIAGLPLWFVVARYLLGKKFLNLPDSFYVQSCPPLVSYATALKSRLTHDSIPVRNQIIIGVLGLLGLVSWIFLYRFEPDVPPLVISQVQAIDQARQEIKRAFSVDLDQEWTPLARVEDDTTSQASRFMWQVYGKEIYNLAQGNYINGLSWLVRFVRFNADVYDREKEYSVVITTRYNPATQSYTPHVISAFHKIPEHYQGVSLDHDHALALAYDFVAKRYLLASQDLSIVSINNDQFEHRRDWTIVFKDNEIFDFQLEGQARIKIMIAGDAIAGYASYIFVPESWKRSDQERAMSISILKMVLSFLMYLLLGLGLFCGIDFFTTTQYASKLIKHKSCYIGLTAIVGLLNSVPKFISYFNTVDPWIHQSVQFLLKFLSGFSYKTLLYSLLLTFGSVGLVKVAFKNRLASFWAAGAMVFFGMGVHALIVYLLPYAGPITSSYAPVHHYFSSVALIVNSCQNVFTIMALLTAFLLIISKYGAKGRYGNFVQAIYSFLVAVSFELFQQDTSILFLMVHGLLMSIVLYILYKLVFQYDATLLVFFASIAVVVIMVPDMVYPAYAYTRIDSLVTGCLLMIFAWFWYDMAHQE